MHSTIRELLAAAEQDFGAQDAFRYKVKDSGNGKKEVRIEAKTYTQLKEDSECFSAVLAELGQQGKHIAIVGPTSYSWVVAYFGTADSGSVVVPLDANLPEADLCELIDRADDAVKSEIENLIAGGTVEKPVHEEITYGEIHKSQDNLWNFLFFTGYLKAVSRRFLVNTLYLTLELPNEEVRYIYQNTVREWFHERGKDCDYTPFYEGMRTGDCEKIEDFINDQLLGSISYFDSAEMFYHGYLLGILGGIGGYRINSNREQGNGRPDLLLEPHNPRMPAMIIEIKCAKKYGQMDQLCDEALAQIEERDYAAELLDEGYQMIYKYGFCFCKKVCRVRFAKV